MTEPEILTLVLATLKRIAPEADLEKLDRRADLRDALDIDSMDFNKFVLLLHDALQVDIPEKDYPKLFTVEGCVRELVRLLPP